MLFINEYNVPKKYVTDIVITGSMASNMWHHGSDIDVHIIVDVDDSEIDSDLFKQLLSVIKVNWSIDHDQTISGYPVELYFQDADSPFFAQGVYSLINNKWIIYPSSAVHVKPDLSKVSHLLSKYKSMTYIVNQLHNSQEYDRAYKLGKKIKSHMKRMRSIGLKSAGQTSAENVVYKVLRDDGTIKTLNQLISRSFEKASSVSEDEIHHTDVELGETELRSISDFIRRIKTRCHKSGPQIIESHSIFQSILK